MHAPLIIDIAGSTLDDKDRRRLIHPRVGGVILFGRNWSGRAALTRTIAEMKDLRPDLLVGVDHEGGRVQRFREDGYTPLPAMRALGQRWLRDDGGPPGTGALQAMEAATAIGHVLGAELRACGVDLSFTPVLDLDHGRSDVIGSRAFGRDARMVTVLARSLALGLLQTGMANCGKHFPGHGWARADTHVASATDERSLDAILADDALPYAQLSTCLRAVMPAHVIYPQVDTRPAGFSSVWLEDVLRDRLGFAGAVFSDDLGMAAARRVPGLRGSGPDGELTMPEAVMQALQAGCDLALVCNQSNVDGGRTLDALLDALDEAEDDGLWQPDPDSEDRRQRLLPQTAPLPWDELMHDGDYQRALERVAQLAADTRD
ncbi:beta-N-acetylhexosaminidase [Sphaerotilus mobilis]|uniref:Beta-hexosaminidase n=1 Tax=Sphaerotilus mobilis TaxID=47994 RepID=A0A4Q7LAC4_9BURK|nr:beta-N-acetylhexosaminidase [Sphaerotilus mobilis]RZS47438.1 beta-N-acetylhexosaminidase [Sphaerotilus mobilis]